MSAVLSAALEYAAHGWPVLPVHGPESRCQHPGKQPWLTAWQEAASTDSEVICGWWESRPDSNVGIVTGPRSGLAVVDIDPRSGGRDSLGVLEARVGVLPGTVQSLTGGGGLHLLYEHPGVKVTSRSKALGPGLDVKADGGFIVAPPSIHAAGPSYEWFGGVWKAGLAAWPTEQLGVETPVSLLAPVPPQSTGGGHPTRRLEALVQFVMDSTEGERNHRLFWAACRAAEMVRDAQINHAVAVDCMQLSAAAVGLSPHEVAATLRSAFLRPVA